MTKDFTGKVAIVTGAGMGIGKAVALRLASEGCDIALVDIDKKLLLETEKEVQSLKRKTMICVADVSQWTQVKEMVDNTIKNFKKIDILVNSAGILGPTVPVWEYSLEDWDRVVAIDLKGTFLVCKAVVKFMLERKSGRIVNIASIAGKDGNPNSCAYTAAKAGVIAFTRGLALEVAKEGIYANSIAPTVIETKMVQGMPEAQLQWLTNKIPMGRFGKPEEVAALVRYLASEECSFSTGACYDISGGRAVY